MQITWSEIEAEAGGYREGFVAIYKKYEGLETDERDGRGAVVKVTKSSFATHMGIAERTFCRWVTNVEQGNVATMAKNAPGGGIKASIEKATAEATAKAEAKAAAALQAEKQRAEAEAKRREVAAAAKAKQEERERADAELAAERQKAKAEKLEALARLEKQLKEAAQKQEFDLSTLTAADKAKVMTMLANDPDSAKEWFRAQQAERTRKLEEETRRAAEAAAKRQEQAQNREAREAARKASLDYDDSALAFYLTKVYPILLQFEERMKQTPITFDHVLYSHQAPSQIVPKFDRGEDIICAGREAIFLANAEHQLADLGE